MSTSPEGRHTGRNAGIATVGIVIVVIALGFVIPAPIVNGVPLPYESTSTSYSTSTTHSPVWVLIPVTTSVPYTTNSTTLIEVTQPSTATTTSYGFGVAQVTLGCDKYTYVSWYLPAERDVTVSWSASDTVDVYLFTSTEYTSYEGGGTTSPSIYSQGSAPPTGSTSFQTSGSDTYYLVLHNPHNGNLCVGSENLAIYSASGETIYAAQHVTTITLPVTYTAISQTVITQTSTTEVASSSTRTSYTTLTLTSTSTTTCTSNLWSKLLGAKCT